MFLHIFFPFFYGLLIIGRTDEIYAQRSLQPLHFVNLTTINYIQGKCSITVIIIFHFFQYKERDVFPILNFGLKPSKHPTDFFCKTLTASYTSTHGGFSVPRRAAERLFRQLPPTQELVVRDLHNNRWTSRHIYRGQLKRHLLTTGSTMFVGAKRLRAGDAVLFIRLVQLFLAKLHFFFPIKI